MTEDDVLDALARQIKAEHTLIAHRLAWYAASQSFLFAAFASAGTQNDLRTFLVFAIPSLGVMLSELARRGIWAAIRVQSDLLREQEYLLRSMEERVVSDPESARVLKAYMKTTCYGRPTRYALHDSAMLSPKIIPIVFLVAWVAAMIFTWRVH